MKYSVIKVDKGYAIEREDGSHVNNTIFDTKEAAQGRLELLIKLGYCKP